MKLISQGAEAKIYSSKGNVVKDRFKKKYRHEELDEKLRKFRVKGEAKILEKLYGLDFPVPRVLNIEKTKIVIEKLKGKLVKDVFDKADKKKILKLSKEIGKKVAFLHSNDVIHADLTTSNMILTDEIYFIDFGLSYISSKVEDRAVDLHLLERALESKHHKVFKDAFSKVLVGYKSYSLASEVLSRLEQVRMRGRNKGK
jgi:Kae1-associated kinase Bud32